MVTHQKKAQHPNQTGPPKKTTVQEQNTPKDLILASPLGWSMINSTGVLMAVFLSLVRYKARVRVPSVVKTCISPSKALQATLI